jgi:glyoxylate reductase
VAILREAGVTFTVCQENEEAGVPRDELLAGVRECDVLLPLLTEAIDREVLTVNDRLLGVAQMAVGFNNIDVDTATELGIPVEAHNYMVESRYKIWGPNLFLGGDVSPGGSGERKTLGVVGYGRIGEAVARRAVGFDMEVLAHDPYNREGVDASEYATWAELGQLLERSDFVTLHPLLTEETHHLIGESELRKMKPTSYLVNASRGPVIDEAALVRALEESWIGGAALDVYEDEPRMASGLAELSNVVLLPHIASASRDTRGRMASMSATNAIAHLRIERAPNVVNPEVYETEAYRRRVGR